MLKALRLAGAVALIGMVLVPRAEAGPLTCDPFAEGDNKDTLFDDVAYRCETVTGSYFTTSGSPDPGSADFFFDSFNIVNTLSFEDVLTDMTISMSAFFVEPGNAAFLDRVPEGYTPATFDTTDGDAWVYFRVEDLQPIVNPPTTPTGTPPQNGTHYADDPSNPGKAWTQTIRWFGLDDTNQIFEVLHDSRPLDTFADVITVAGSFDPTGSPCQVYPGNCTPPSECCSDFLFGGEFGGASVHDPAIGGSADDFSDTLVVVSQVPEPATMLLLLTGLAGAGMERRRRNRARR